MEEGRITGKKRGNSSDFYARFRYLQLTRARY